MHDSVKTPDAEPRLTLHGLPIFTELGMHLTQVAPTGCYPVRSDLEGLAMWA
jgi:hypothetical protein